VSLRFSQEDIALRGCAIECRINAYAPGRLTALHVPGGPFVRFDSYLVPDMEVSPYYDALLGKLIVRGANREEAIACCRRALDEIVITGVKTTLPFQKRVLHNRSFVEGKYDTGFVEKMMKERQNPPQKEN